MEKVSGEVKLLEEMVEFMEKISVRNFEKLTIDDRKVLTMARNNVNAVHREMSAVILSSLLAVDVSLIVKDYRSKVEKELNDICTKVSNLTIKVDIKDYVDSFHQHDDAVIDDEISAYFKKWNKLTLEFEDYRQTLQLMDDLFVIARKEQVSEKNLSILSRAYNMIMMVYLDLYDTLDSNQSSSVRDIVVSLTINESRSKVEKELNYICNNMTNHSIKEAISRHLDAFKAGHLPKKLFPRILTDRKRVSSQSEMKTANKKSKLGSVDGEFRSDADPGYGYHDHIKRIKKQREPLYIQINAIFEDSEPECVGEGIVNAIFDDSEPECEGEGIVNAIFEDSEPECVGEGIEIQHADDSLEDEYEMSDGIFSF